MAHPSSGAPAGGRRGRGLRLAAAACAAALLLALAPAGFVLPLGRRGLLGGGLLAAGTAGPAHAKEDRYVTLEVDVEGGDGPATEQVQIRLRPDWAPRGVRRFLKLVALGDLDGAAFYHVDKRSGAYFGLPAEPSLPLPPIKNDLVRAPNRRGTVTFDAADYGRGSRLFINYKDNTSLDRRGYAPIGEVVGDGMEVIDRLYSGYGTRPDEEEVQKTGNNYLDKEFPKIPKIKSADIMA